DAAAKLVYNDYNIETVNPKTDAVYAMASDFKKRSIPIDGIGLQMHLDSSGIDAASLASHMSRFAALGLEIYITEMDVRFPTPLSTADRQAQADIYRSVVDACRAQP